MKIIAVNKTTGRIVGHIYPDYTIKYTNSVFLALEFNSYTHAAYTVNEYNNQCNDYNSFIGTIGVNISFTEPSFIFLGEAKL